MNLRKLVITHQKELAELMLDEVERDIFVQLQHIPESRRTAKALADIYRLSDTAIIKRLHRMERKGYITKRRGMGTLYYWEIKDLNQYNGEANG